MWHIWCPGVFQDFKLLKWVLKEVSETLHAAFQRVKCSKVRSARRISRPRRSQQKFPKQRQRRSPNTWQTHRPKHMFIQISLLLSGIRIGVTFLSTSIICFIALIDCEKEDKAERNTWQNGGNNNISKTFPAHLQLLSPPGAARAESLGLKLYNSPLQLFSLPVWTLKPRVLCHLLSVGNQVLLLHWSWPPHTVKSCSRASSTSARSCA